jgi:hypothetical protein
MGPIVALFNFTIRQTLLSRKIWLTVLILAAPCVLLLVIRSVAPPVHNAKSLWEMYHVVAHIFLMSVLLPLVCLVHGTAMIGTDVEARTIVYLITRRMRRVTVLIVKFIATALVLAVLCDLGMIGLHLCALAGRDVSSLVAHSSYADWNPANDLCCYLMIIPVGVLGFLAVFNLIGLLTARPLAMSVFYLIAVEVILSNIPLRARMYTLLHQLRVTVAGVMPRVCDLYELPSTLREELYPQGTTALPELFGVVLVALVLSGVLITLRELMPAKVSRE